jgi:hypothetical protein
VAPIANSPHLWFGSSRIIITAALPTNTYVGPAAITRVDLDVLAQTGRAMAFVVKTFETL